MLIRWAAVDCNKYCTDLDIRKIALERSYVAVVQGL
jgi:hypothetical protein